VPLRPLDDVPRGVLRTPGAGRWTLRRWAPGERLAGYVSWYWSVSWELGGHRHEQAVLPHPAANLAVEYGRTWLHGPVSRRYDRTLTGCGRVVAVRFRPGALRPLLGAPVAGVTDRIRPGDQAARVSSGAPASGTLPGGAAEPDPVGAALPGLDGAALARAVAAEPDVARAAELLEDALRPLLPAAPDPAARQAARAVELAERDRALVRVDQLAERLGTGRRTLHRLFTEHVGLGPAWVLRRYRLHEVAARALSGDPVDWARLAAELGYTDQAHLVRDFTATVGTPPARYAAG
jgi:AraC-like DNA-binding protein